MPEDLSKSRLHPTVLFTGFELHFAPDFSSAGIILSSWRRIRVEVIRAASEEGWGAFARSLTRACALCLAVTEAIETPLSTPKSVFALARASDVDVADAENFMLCDFQRGFRVRLGDARNGGGSSAASLSFSCAGPDVDGAACVGSAAWRTSGARTAAA